MFLKLPTPRIALRVRRAIRGEWLSSFSSVSTGRRRSGLVRVYPDNHAATLSPISFITSSSVRPDDLRT